jgi:hypothetical protein
MVAVIGGAALLAAGAVSGATTPVVDTRRNVFSLLDHDKDGFISYSEAKADPALSDDFNRLDNDKNGELDRGEFAQFEAQGFTNSPDILPPEQPRDAEKAPSLPPRGGS